MGSVTRKQFLAACGSTLVTTLAGARDVRGSAGHGNVSRDSPPGRDARPMTAERAEPSYVALHRSGELKRRGEALWQLQESCQLCPRRCGAARLRGERGFCGASSALEVASYHPHFGEEAPLVGRGGSGTVFLRHCNLRCVFCINEDISQGRPGERSTTSELADMMLALQQRGCHNINVVTPTHFSPHILLALDEAARRGLHVPLVYNTSGWERVEILRLLDGVVDIYLPDVKYASAEMADRYSSGARDYPDITRQAALEMHRQVGVARPGADGLMRRGLMIRHLVMPNNVSGTRAVLGWIATHLPKDTYVNLMSQYRPSFRADEFPALARRITRREYEDAVACAREVGLTNVEIQGYSWL